MKNRVKRFRLSDYETRRPLVVIEATDEEHALSRCRTVSSLIDLNEHDIFAIDEHGADEPVTVPFFMDAYFLVAEATAEATRSSIH